MNAQLETHESQLNDIDVEFLYWEDCPSHERALEILRETLAEEGLDAGVRITRIDSEEDVERRHFPGSPTIRVNGRDIDGEDLPPPALTCRTYVTDEGKISPLPPRTRIVKALRSIKKLKETA